jgi:hypothetical protein
MRNYKGIYIPACPNRCFERIVDAGIAENVVDGMEPRIAPNGIGSSCFAFRRYSKKLKRHGHTVNGHYYSERWTHCPHCGEKLEG